MALTVRYLRPQPSAWQLWWLANRFTLALLAVWAAALVAAGSMTPLDASGPSRLYRVQYADGAFLVTRAVSRSECEVIEPADGLCTWTNEGTSQGVIEPQVSPVVLP